MEEYRNVDQWRSLPAFEALLTIVNGNLVELRIIGCGHSLPLHGDQPQVAAPGKTDVLEPCALPNQGGQNRLLDG